MEVVRMRRKVVLSAALVIGILTSLVVLVTAAQTRPQPYGEPIGPKVPADTGAGEELLLVVGGIYASEAEAAAAAAAMPFGDVQGYYVAPADQFEGLTEQIGPGAFVLVSSFRTDKGASVFAAFARLHGNPATIVPNRVLSLGGAYTGLGQEESPDGKGPALAPLPESLP
jgi:hypothetical protein